LLAALCGVFLLASSPAARTGPADTIERLYASKRELTDWEAILLGLGGVPIRAPLFATPYFTRLERELAANGGAYRLATDYARVVLVYRANGLDASDAAGYDLVARLKAFDAHDAQGANAYIWSLIALRGEDAHTTAPLVAALLEYQRADGGFGLTAAQTAASDADVTAMAAAALSPYMNKSDVKAAVEAALAFLAESQNADGTFSTYGVANAASLAQVVIALCAVGSPDDARFVKDGKGPLEVLDTYRLSDGRYAHTAGSKTPDAVATRQALLALLAVEYAREGRGSVFGFE
jgi:hypothetical protein